MLSVRVTRVLNALVATDAIKIYRYASLEHSILSMLTITSFEFLTRLVDFSMSSRCSEVSGTHYDNFKNSQSSRYSWPCRRELSIFSLDPSMLSTPSEVLARASRASRLFDSLDIFGESIGSIKSIHGIPWQEWRYVILQTKCGTLNPNLSVVLRTKCGLRNADRTLPC